MRIIFYTINNTNLILTCSLLHSVTGVLCQKYEFLLSLLMLQEDRLRSDGFIVLQEILSCLDGDTDPDDRLEGEGGVGDAPD